MKKMIGLTLLLLLLPFSAHAHSGLVSSDPSDGESVEGSITDITIEFDLPVQRGNLTVTSDGGEEIRLSDVQTSGQTLTGKWNEELAAGTYQIEWDVISQDGHKVEGVIGFEAAFIEPSNPEKHEKVEPEVAAEQADDEGGFSLMTGILFMVLILAVILFGFMVRRK